MSETDQLSSTTLQESLKSVQKLQRGSGVSILGMLLGLAVVIGSFVYSFTMLRPLNNQIAEKQVEVLNANKQLTVVQEKLNDANKRLSLVEEEIALRGDESRKVKDDIEEAKAQLNSIKQQTNHAVDELNKIKIRLPAQERAVIDSAISNIEAVKSNVTRVEGELTTKQTTPSEAAPSRSQAISDLFSDQAAVRIRAYRALMDYYSTDPNLIPGLLSFARNHLDNQNGIYNALVVLSHLDKKQTKPYVSEIRAFAQQVAGMGPRISDRVDKLLGRLPK